jgi:dimethylargininase
VTSTGQLVALTRAVPPSIVRCELTHLEREPIDVPRAAAQHAAYEETLARAGCAIRHLPEEPDLPDSVFVEDTAVVLDELAVITRPGASSRRAETTSVAATLGEYRPLACIAAPGTLDGGDVLVVGRRVYVGLSGRTNVDGLRQLAALLAPHGYRASAIDVRQCLHLKSAASAVGDDVVLVNPRWVDAGQFGAARRIEVHPDEPFAANALAIDETVLCAAAAPWTAERLRSAGFAVESVAVSELAKAEAGLTCCSLIVPMRPTS